MSDSVADIAISLRADVSPFERGMRQARRSMSNFQRGSRGMAVAMARVGAAAAAAAAAVGVAGAAMGRSAASAAVEIDRLARISATTPREFQRMAQAADTVRISQEKLADIFRDVQDRVGDFIQTGGGPMADFFENIAPLVGVTADQFARLSGPDALQLYVSSLERANLSQADMVFYMEAMASDSSDLLPLLRDNGRAMRELGDAAERAGRVMSNEAVANGRELDRVLRDVAQTIRTSFGNAILENADDIEELARWLGEALPAAIDLAVRGMQAMVPIIEAISTAINTVAGAVNSVVEAWQRSNEFRGGRAATAGLIEERRNPGMTQGGVLTGNAADLLPIGMTQGGTLSGSGFSNLPPGSTFALPGVDFASGTGGASGGGGGRDWQAEFEAMQERFMTEQELIRENYEQQMEMLREFRERRIGTEEEYNELERRINAEHAEQMRQQEQAAMQARLQIVSGALGNLATIFENSGQRNLNAVRALRTAEAVIEGYSAAVAAWRQGMTQGGPPLAAAYTAASLARTGALISQIQSSGKGGGGASAGMAAAGSGMAASPQVSRNVAIQLSGGDLYSRDQVVQLINSINEAVEDGAIVRLV